MIIMVFPRAGAWLQRVGQGDGGRGPGGNFLIWQWVSENGWKGRFLVPGDFRDPVRREAPEALKKGFQVNELGWVSQVSGEKSRETVCAETRAGGAVPAHRRGRKRPRSLNRLKRVSRLGRVMGRLVGEPSTGKEDPKPGERGQRRPVVGEGSGVCTAAEHLLASASLMERYRPGLPHR